ncbi:MAG: hypothetical protein DYG94_04660 [Leptolyngbya sp. PLA3]|nr:MAG: hypothetical protein EDM82_03810 [Cyanobacteria bacterium CYA]MCE7968023.1 hypothetical protein [Leptolyngbya sp. PL-A3]
METTFEITLGGEYRLVGRIVQGDDNDAFRILYGHMDAGLFQALWDVANYDAWGARMQTRRSPDNNAEIFFFDVARVTDTIRLVAVSGDNMYSVSEIQVYIPARSAAGVLARGGLWSLLQRRSAGSGEDREHAARSAHAAFSFCRAPYRSDHVGPVRQFVLSHQR